MKQLFIVLIAIGTLSCNSKEEVKRYKYPWMKDYEVRQSTGYWYGRYVVVTDVMKKKKLLDGSSGSSIITPNLLFVGKTPVITSSTRTSSSSRRKGFYNPYTVIYISSRKPMDLDSAAKLGRARIIEHMNLFWTTNQRLKRRNEALEEI